MLYGYQGDIQMSETHHEMLWRGFPKTLLEFEEQFGNRGGVPRIPCRVPLERMAALRSLRQ
jgi:hypothetical protein